MISQSLYSHTDRYNCYNYTSNHHENSSSDFRNHINCKKSSPYLNQPYKHLIKINIKSKFTETKQSSIKNKLNSKVYSSSDQTYITKRFISEKIKQSHFCILRGNRTISQHSLYLLRLQLIHAIESSDSIERFSKSLLSFFKSKFWSFLDESESKHRQNAWNQYEKSHNILPLVYEIAQERNKRNSE